MVNYLNNENHNGGYWLPNIQRPFVWSEEQIEKLFDSIMRYYPISTMLVWKTDSKIRRRKFIDCFHRNLRLTDFYVPEDENPKLLVLDGQQRLQSLFIGLKGSYDKKELYLDILSGDKVAPEDIKFKFKFIESSSAEFPFLKLKDIVFSTLPPNKLSKKITEKSNIKLDEKQVERIEDNVWKIYDVFATNETLNFQELDSIDDPEKYSEDDVVEIFIRANSGGTKLGKSDLLFSLLTAVWDDAEKSIEELLNDLNKEGYKFTRDFILKTCLVLLGKGARYDVAKFRDETTREKIIEKWARISDALKDVKDYLYGKTFIRSDKSLPSYLSLIPLIYYRYKKGSNWEENNDFGSYIIRTLLAGAFGGSPDNLIDKCVKDIKEKRDFDVKSLFGVISADGRNLRIAPEDLLETSYGYKELHLVFNLWYQGFNYQPAFKENQPQVDHIFPQSLLKTVKKANPETGHMNLLKYYAFDRDQIANCMLLSKQENGAGGKTDIPPEEWFKDKTDKYLDMHLIPKDKALWKLENYEKFIEARKKLILDKFSDILQADEEE